MSATTKQLLSSGEFCQLRYDTIPVKMHLQSFPSVPLTENCRILSCDTLVANEQYIFNITKFKKESVSMHNVYFIVFQLPTFA
jgi:hypothetical protein